MPARKTYRKKAYRRPRYSRPTQPKALQYATMAYSAYKMAKKLKSIVNSESKHHDALATTAISSTGAVVHLSDIAQGDTNITRDGLSIKPSSIYLQGQYVINASATRTSVRTVLVMDRRPDTGAPTWANVYESAAINSLREIDANQGRFRILYERFDTLDSGSKGISIWNKYVPLNGIHCKFDGATATDTSMNAFYLLQVSSEPTNTPSQNLQSRIRFFDN